MNRRPDQEKRMLVTRLSALGDVAMTIPAIYSLAARYPRLKIYVLTRPFFKRLFVNCPGNVKVLTADFGGEHRGFRGTMRLLRTLSRLKPDYVADLHNVSRSWIIDAWMRLHGVRVAMVDKNRRGRRRLFTRKEAQRNYVDRYADVFARLGYPIDLTFGSLFDSHPARAPFEPCHPAIGIAPFARYYNKTYPPEMMRRVVELLCSRGIHVYLFGGRGKEESELSGWAAQIKGCTSVAGAYPIESELALMNRMDLMVSMDSANQHMAALAGTRVISIWGSTTPECGFMGYHQSADDAVVARLECQPCSVAGKPTCPLRHLDCLCSLKPDYVADRIAAALGSVPVAPSDTTGNLN